MKSFSMLRSSPMNAQGPERFYIDGKPVKRDEYRKLDCYAARSDRFVTVARGGRWHHRRVVYL